LRVRKLGKRRLQIDTKATPLKHLKDIEMTVKRKAIPAKKPAQSDLDAIINKGGKTAEDSKPQAIEAETRFTLRIPPKLIAKIDKDRKARVGNVSRNQWILEAVAERLK
jgi:hypothetical protein